MMKDSGDTKNIMTKHMNMNMDNHTYIFRMSFISCLQAIEDPRIAMSPGKRFSMWISASQFGAASLSRSPVELDLVTTNLLDLTPVLRWLARGFIQRVEYVEDPRARRL